MFYDSATVDDLPSGLGSRADWFIPESEIEKLESQIRASNDLPECKAFVAKIAQTKYGNLVTEAAIALTTGEVEPDYSDPALEQLCTEAGQTVADFQSAVASMAKVMMKRVELKNKLNELLN